MTHHTTPETFLKDVATHRMEVLRDDGLYRHVRFKRPGSSCMYFDLITWPGSLCYTGDMGTFVFSRLPDMFEFFRASDEARLFQIDRRYWAEKVNAGDKSDGVTEFSEEKFVENLRRWFNEWADQLDPPLASVQRAELLVELESNATAPIRDYGSSGALQAYRAVIDFEHDEDHPFTDFFETNSNVHTQRFTWCCYALRWGISQYDKGKTSHLN
jgi:hypothetical protein